MQQRDLLKDQIEQLGRVLSKVIAHLLQLQQTSDLPPGLQEAIRETKDKTGIDLDQLLGQDRTTLAAYAEAHQLTAEHLDHLVDYLTQIAELVGPLERHTCLTTALHLLEVADRRSQTYSFSRQATRGHLLTQLG